MTIDLEMTEKCESDYNNDAYIYTKNYFTLAPCTAKLFYPIFHSFEAGIASAISSFKWREIIIFMKNRHFKYWHLGLIKRLPWIIISNLVIFLLIQNCLKSDMVPAAQGLTNKSIFYSSSTKTASIAAIVPFWSQTKRIIRLWTNKVALSVALNALHANNIYTKNFFTLTNKSIFSSKSRV